MKSESMGDMRKNKYYFYNIMEVKNSNVRLTVAHIAKNQDTVVCVSMSMLNLSAHAIKMLQCETPDSHPMISKGYEESALVFAVFEKIKTKLMGSVLESSK